MTMQAQTTQAQRAVVERADVAEPTPIRVLLVEDDAEDGALARRALGRMESFRCDVTWASTFEEAVDELRGNAPDLLILDHQLGAHTGFELLTEAFGSHPTLPVVLLTGTADHAVDVRASRSGISSLIEKSALTTAVLERSARYAIERARTERELRSARTFFREGFDALEELAVILDSTGAIVNVNAAWRKFGMQNGRPEARPWEGMNYLGVCDTAVGEEATEASAVARGVRELLAGTSTSFRLEYPCHSPDEERWFALRAVRFEDEGQPMIYVAHHDVTKRFVAERALRASESRFRRLVETAHEGICAVDAAGAITYANERLLDMLGYADADVRGRKIFDFMTGEGADASRMRFKCRALGVQESEEILLRRRDGRELWVRESASALFDDDGAFTGATLMLGDVTARRTAEAALQAARRETDLLLASTGEGILAVDRSRSCTFANPAASRLFGVDASAIVGQKVHALFRHATADSAASSVDRCVEETIRDGTTHRIDDALFWRHDTVSYPVAYSCTPIREGGDIVGAAVVFRDITQRKELEAQLRQAQKMEAIGQLAGGVAHDFNNMLTVITSYTMMLLSELPASDPMSADLREIAAASDRAAALTRQLLAYSRQQVLQPRIITLGQVVRDLNGMLRRLINEDVELRIVDTSESAQVLADPGQIEQVVMNLVVNARDAMPAGGTLSIDVDRVIVDAGGRPINAGAGEGAYVALTVCDTGSGMDEQTALRMFDPFFTTKELGKGTGLGLATVQGIVNQSGGFIGVKTSPGAGTTFEILLPEMAAQVTDVYVELAEAPIEERFATVLLVEDDQPLQKIIERILQVRGYHVLCANDGVAALALLAETGQRVDLLVTDIVMPRMSGQELASRISEVQGAIPVLFLSGHSSDAIANHGVLRVDSQLLNKPFKPHDLASAVATLLHAPIRSATGTTPRWTTVTARSEDERR